MARWIAWIALGFAVLIAAAWLLVGRFDFGPLAARRASAALGRPVAIEALRVTPGRWIGVELRGARLDNIAGGSRPAMAELGAATAEVEAVSLLRGPVVIRGLAVDGLRVLLERAADGTGNWKFGPDRPDRPAPPGPTGRTGFPVPLDARLKDAEVVYRTSSGAALRTRLDEAALRTAGLDRPVRLTGSGAYNDVPVALEGDLAPIAVLRDAAVPYGTDLRFTSGDTVLRFQGTMTDPLNIDGARGVLSLDAPTPAVLLAVAGLDGAGEAAVRLSGTLEHAGPVWHWNDASGVLSGAAIASASLRLVEGGRGEPDSVAVDLAFDDLDLNELLGEGPRGARTDADLPLDIARAPDTLVAVRLSARRLAYADVRAEDVRLAASLTPGRVAVEDLSLIYLGARVRAEGRIEADARPGQGRVEAGVDVSGMDVQRLRRALGVGSVPLPLLGRVDGRFAADARGVTLNTAARAAHASAVLAMDGGSVGREVIEIASIDLRGLFRTARGMSAMSCLVAVMDLRAGVATVAPLRIRSEAGTVTGHGRFDLYRRTLDVVVGSESATTGALALDIPVRVSGPFDDPTVRPATWSAAGRAMLAAGDDVGRLLPSLRPFARRSPCLSRGGSR